MEDIHVKKQETFFKVLKALLIVAAAGFVIVKIYQKFFKNKSVDMMNDLEGLDELELLEEEDEADEQAADVAPALEEAEAVADAEVEDEVTFEVAADDVIANAEDME